MLTLVSKRRCDFTTWPVDAQHVPLALPTVCGAPVQDWREADPPATTDAARREAGGVCATHWQTVYACAYCGAYCGQDSLCPTCRTAVPAECERPGP
jgi:hypothetical protein